jgi:hypothetical protein
MVVEHRVHAPEPEAHRRLARVARGRVDQHDRLHRPVGDERGVFLHLLRIGQVVVDAVRVVGRRRKAEQPRLVHRHGLVEIGRLDLGHSFGRRVGLGDVQVDDVLLLLDEGAVLALDLVRDGDEDHLPRAARFRRHGEDFRLSASAARRPGAAVKTQLARRPHPPLEGERRQEAGRASGARPRPVRPAARTPETPPSARAGQKRRSPVSRSIASGWCDTRPSACRPVAASACPSLLGAPDPILGALHVDHGKCAPPGSCGFLHIEDAGHRLAHHRRVGATVIPASCRITTFSCALSPKAEMIAPAWPILRPLGAERPAT